MDTPPIPAAPKKGLGPLAWVGIGCGSLVVLGIIAFAVVALVFGPKAKQMIEDAQKNPTRMVASTMVSVSAGQMELIAEDDVNKRYTVRTKQSGRLNTVYLSRKKSAPEVIEGDFSAIPADDTTAEPPPPK